MELINEVPDMSKLESEEIVLENKDFDINRLLHENKRSDRKTGIMNVESAYLKKNNNLKIQIFEWESGPFKKESL